MISKIIDMKNNINLQKNKDRWDEILKKFRDACYLFHFKDQTSANIILKKKLPKMINDWQKESGIEKNKYKQKIKHTFTVEQMRVANAFLLRKALQEETMQQNFNKKSLDQEKLNEEMMLDEIEKIIDKENFYCMDQNIEK